MKLSNLGEKYYNDGNNCARATLMAANEQYNLGIADIDISMLSGFGGGMTIEAACGVVTGGIAAIGKYMALNPSNKELKDVVSDYIAQFEKRLSSVNCSVLKEKYKTKDKGCVETVIIGADVLESIIANINKTS